MKTSENTMVVPYNFTKIKNEISKLINVDPGQIILDHGARYQKNVIVDAECCYWFIEKHLIDNKVQLVMNVPVRIKKPGDTPGSFHIPMMTEFYYPIKEDDMANYELEPITLREHMGQRYNYNPRITKNMREFLADVVSQVKEEA